MDTNTGDPPSHELLARWQNGDQKAGEFLFHRYYDRLERFFLNKLALAVEDLVHQTLLGAIEGLERLRDPAKFESYLFAIAYNVLRTHLRELYKHRGQRDIDDLPIEEIAPGPITILTEHEEEYLLLMALRRIPHELQVILELHYWEQRTTADIADILDMPVGTVRSRMQRARKRVGEAIATLDTSPELLESTTSNLDDWAAACRRRIEEMSRSRESPGELVIGGSPDESAVTVDA